MKYTHLAVVGAFLVFIPLFPLKAQAFSTVSVSGGVATVTIQSDEAIPNALIDLEVYSDLAQGSKVGQVYVNTDIPAGTLTCTWNATFFSGSNAVKVGIFSSDWSTLYNWNNYAAAVEGPYQGDNTVHCSNEAASAPTFTTSAKVEGYTPGANGMFTTTVQSTQNVSSVLVDTEIYSDSSNTKIGQWFETVNLAANVPFLLRHASALPSAIGFYYTKVGVFASDWSKLYSWNENADEFKISPDPAVPYFESSAQAEGFNDVFDPNATIYSTIFSSQDISDALLDTEVYDASGHKVLQHFVTQDLWADNAAQLQWNLFDSSLPEGQYTFKVGIFSSDWSHLYHWNERAGTLSIDKTHVGSLSITRDPAFPAYQTVAGGTTGISVGTYVFHASNEGVAVRRLGLVLASDGSPVDIQKVYVYDGSTLVGSEVFTSPAATVTFSAPIFISKDSDHVITIKADFSRVGTQQPGVEGDLVQIAPTLAIASGISSGTEIDGIGPGFGPEIRVFRTYPIIALGTISPSGVSDGKLLRFTVTGNPSGSLFVNTFTFTVATTAATVSDLQLYAYSDPNHTFPANGTFGGIVGGNVHAIGQGMFSFTPTLRPFGINEGMTTYFQLIGTVSGAQPDSSVTSTLVGDSAFSGMLQAPQVQGNFIWSPAATGTPNVTSQDWTNGYGLPGLPATGLTQTRTY